VALDKEAPRRVDGLGTGLGLSPAVVRARIVVHGTYLSRHVGGKTGEEEGTTGIVVVSELYGCLNGFRSSTLEGCLSVYAAIFMEVPPYHLALAKVYRAVFDVGKRGVDGVGNVGQHPLAGGLLFDVELVHGCRQSYIYRRGFPILVTVTTYSVFAVLLVTVNVTGWVKSVVCR
jgi:hypothetical protein